jgi:hypothetical protein
VGGVINNETGGSGNVGVLPSSSSKLDLISSSSSNRQDNNSLSLLKIPTPSLSAMFPTPPSMMMESHPVRNYACITRKRFLQLLLPVVVTEAAEAVVWCLNNCSRRNVSAKWMSSIRKRFAKFAANNFATNIFCGRTNSKNMESDPCPNSSRNNHINSHRVINQNHLRRLE